MPDPITPPRAGRVPTFSVAIAAYEAAAYIGEAVESALAQTLPPHEIIVADDGSADDIEGALAPFGEAVTLLRLPHAGEGAAKRAAAAAASGEFVVILDSDDLFLPERLKSLGELAAARPDLDLLTTDAWVEVEGERVRRAYEDASAFPLEDQLRRMIDANFVFGLAAVRRSRLEAVGGFDATIVEVADWHCWIRLLLDGAAAGMVYEPLAVYRIRRESLSANRARHLRSRVTMLERLVGSPALSAAGVADELDRSLAHHRRRAELEELRVAVAEGSPEARRRALAVARSRHPLAIRAKAGLTALAPALAHRRVAGADGRPSSA